MIFNFAFVQTDINPFGVAIFHTIYNIFTAFMLFPFGKLIERLSVKYIPESKADIEKKAVLLDDRLLLTPAFAIAECYEKAVEMGETAQINFLNATKMLKNYNQEIADSIVENEEKIQELFFLVLQFL